MRLVFKPRGANAGLNRYKGEGIYKSIGRKVYLSGVRKRTKEEADADPDKKIERGEGIDDVDSSNIDESGSDKESSIETISNFTEEESVNDDKESNMDNEEEVVNDDKESEIDNKEEVVNDDTEDGVDEEEMSVKDDDITPTTDVKRKYSPSVIDFLINNNADKTSIPVPPKLRSLDSSISSCRDNDGFDTHQNKLLNEKKDHALIKIPPTKRKRYPQKICVHCRGNLGVRNDTRYICTLCDVALCKQPCFSEYHCNK